MTPADTLALSADKLSQLLRDTIRERVLAAQAGEQMRSDVLGLDVQAICDVAAGAGESVELTERDDEFESTRAVAA